MKKSYRRTPRNYDGTKTTTKKFRDVVGQFLSRLSGVRKDQPDVILASWQHIVGDRIAKMTHAVSFNEGILFVKVKNSTLHSLLSQSEKPKILLSYRQKFPNVSIRDIIFRVG